MEQHTGIPKKPLYIEVFATPIPPKATSNKQTKNSYFRHLQNQKFRFIVMPVDEARPQTTRIKLLSTQS